MDAYGGDYGYGGGFGGGAEYGMGGGGGGSFYGGDAAMGGGGGGDYGATGGFSQHADKGAASTPAKQRNIGAYGMVPVTVAQLKKAISMASEDGEVTVHGKDLRHFHFRVVGRISALQPLTTQMIFTIEDSTESIQVTWWVDSEETPFITERKSSWNVGAYVVVTGQVKAFGTDVQLQAFDVRPVVDFNEVTHHFLEVVYTHLYVTKGPLEAPAPAGGSAPMAGGYGGPSRGGAPVGGFGGGSSFNPTSGFGGAPVAAAFGGYSAGGMGGDGGSLSSVQKLVLDAFVSGNSLEHGLSVEEVARKLAPQNVFLADVRRAAEFLQLEGHLYTTKDEVHFKSTSS